MTTPTISALGNRQQQLLLALLEHKSGLGADELADLLDISRSAIHQHLSVLENGGLIEKLVRPSTGGRPSHAWRLTDEGVDLFPKQYALFSGLMIQTLKKSLGPEGLIEVLRQLGRDIAEEVAPRLRDKSVAERIEATAGIMRELGYQARAIKDDRHALPMIDARNCVYHQLAREHSEVCELDLALLSSLLGRDIEHVECMLRGGEACRFRAMPETKVAESSRNIRRAGRSRS